MLTCAVLTVLLYSGKNASLLNKRKKSHHSSSRECRVFFFSKTKTVIETLPSERAVWGERLFSALQGGGGGYVCLCVYVQLLQSMQEGGRGRKYQSVHGLNKQHYAGCCQLEEEPRNVAVATSSRTLLVIKPACVDTCGSEWHERDIYRLSYYSLYHYFCFPWQQNLLCGQYTWLNHIKSIYECHCAKLMTISSFPHPDCSQEGIRGCINHLPSQLPSPSFVFGSTGSKNWVRGSYITAAGIRLAGLAPWPSGTLYKKSASVTTSATEN